MQIEFRKDPLTSTQETTVSCDAVPRVGEVIETDTNSYLVHEVFYTFNAQTNTLTPKVYCHVIDYNDQDQCRRSILKEHGWLNLHE